MSLHLAYARCEHLSQTSHCHLVRVQRRPTYVTLQVSGCVLVRMVCTALRRAEHQREQDHV